MIAAAERCRYALLALLCAVCRAASLHARAEDEGSGSGSGSGTGDEPPLSPEAIANISATVAALFVIGCALCYLLMCFNRAERMQRVRMAQERNKQISQQIEAAKQKRRAQQQQLSGGGQLETSREEERRAAGGLLFSQSHHSHEDPAGASRDKESSPTQPLVSSTRTSPSRPT